MQPEAQSFLESSPGPASSGDSPGGAAPGNTVQVWDEPGARRDLIGGVIRDSGGIPIIHDAGNVVGGTRAPERAGILLMAVAGGEKPDAHVCELIARIRRDGGRVIAFGGGADHWPIRWKCGPLLAGATRLLDSGSPTFAHELRRILEQEIEAVAALREEQQRIRALMIEEGIIGTSAALTEAFRLAMRFGRLSDLPVLITGESGTGKELLARAVTRMDPKRNAGPFVGINCAAVQPALFESEFFGHRRGAFTGAERDRKGWIRAAEGGVLFLDEIGELEPGLQAKLLRVLQDNRVLAVGEEREVRVSVRFIAATNRNLERLVREGRFRADLFHRLRVLLIHLPPLRERPADLPPLVNHFLRKQGAAMADRAGGVSPDFLDALQQLELPGNVRELENLVREALVNHPDSGRLDLSDLPPDVLNQLGGQPAERDIGSGRTIAEPGPIPAPSAPDPTSELVRRILDSQEWSLPRVLSECERQVFHVALQRTRGNQSHAARLLGITPRSVYNKIRKYRLPA